MGRPKPTTQPVENKPALLEGPSYRTHVSTDKPIYRPGDTLRWRGVIMSAITHQIVASETDNSWPFVKILSPKGDKIFEKKLNLPHNGTIGGEWPIPKDISGGNYICRIHFPHDAGYAPAEREFNIRSHQVKRLKTQLVFEKKGYSPSEVAVANLTVERSEGGIPANAPVEAIARIDGIEAWRGDFNVDAEGKVTVQFKLPDKGSTGTLSCVITDGGVVETASKTIPILLHSLDIQMFPEAGDLIVGLECGLYVEAYTPVGDPADIEGQIEEVETGQAVATIMTTHEGRGYTKFTPQAGKTYHLRTMKPSGITIPNLLPLPVSHGVTVSAHHCVAGDSLHVTASATDQGEYLLTAHKVGVEIGRVSAKIGPEQSDVVIPITPVSLVPEKPKPKTAPPVEESSSLMDRIKFWDTKVQPQEEKEEKKEEPVPVIPDREEYVDGVVRITVTKNDKPIAERLVFVVPKCHIDVQVTPDRDAYSPGDTVKIKLSATSDGKPVNGGCRLAITVTDDSVLEMVEKRKQAPRLPSMVLLEDEVLELNDAAQYVVWSDGFDGQALSRIDLVLGTQGWRRFAFEGDKRVEFLKKHQDKAKRVLVYNEAKPKPKPKVVRPGGDWRGGGRGRGGGAMFGVVKRGPMPPGAGPVMRGAVPSPALAMAPRRAMMKQKAAPPPAPPPAVPAAAPAMQAAPIMQDLAPPPPPPADAVDGLLAFDMEKREEEELCDSSSSDASDDDDMEMEMEMEREQQAALGKRAKKGRRGRASRRVVHDVDEDLVIYREYYHRKRPDRQAGERTDFVECLVFAHEVDTNDNGEASIKFDLNDSVTGFKVAVDAHGLTETILGDSSAVIESKEPFYIEPKMPLEVSAGDNVSLPIALVNETNTTLHGIITHAVNGTGLSVDPSIGTELAFDLAASERARRLMAVQVNDVTSSTQTELTLTAKAGPFKDSVTRTSLVAPHGFPYKLCKSGQLQPNGKMSNELVVTDSMIPGSVVTSIKIYPSPAASLTEALQALLREPYGCFEQTSSTTYPLIMAMQYFKSHTGVKKSIVKDAKDKLVAGHKRLVGYESKGGGFEWFGSSPAHEALTAYGVLEFCDMADVINVDKDVLDRGQKWLETRRDGNGGFLRNKRALDSFGGAPPDTTNAYIVYSLVASGKSDCVGQKEIDALIKEARVSKACPYIRGLATATLYSVGRIDEAKALAQDLVSQQKDDGCVPSAKATITRSGAGAKDTETTAICVLAWMHDLDSFLEPCKKAIDWLTKQCKDGRFYSTQATILALKAIVQWDKKMSAEAKPGIIYVEVNGKRVAELNYEPSEENVSSVSLPSFADALSMPGQYDISVCMDDGFKMPYSIAVDFFATVGDTAPECQVELSTALNDGVYKEGEGGEVEVVLTSKNAAEGLPMTIAIIGLPGGLEPRHEQLKELVKSDVVSFYETRGREVILYWRCLEPGAVKKFMIDVVATVPGVYTGPASRTYLYYTDEHKYWVAPMSAKIHAK